MSEPALAEAHALGKVILLGEHAVVYGHPALAGALERGVTATATSEAARSELVVDGWGRGCTIDEDTPLAEAFRALVAGVGARGPVRVAVRANLPSGAGLGSSAALAVAVTRALAAATGRALDLGETERIADLAERVFHDNPSGIDVALAARGGLGSFERGVGLTPIDAPPVPLVVGLSGEPRSTAAMVRKVAAGLVANRAPLARLGEAARDGVAVVRAGDLSALGRLFDAAHTDLRAIGVSTARLDQLVTIARGAGALGAKLTGAGGGGSVIALAPGCEADILHAWRDVGFDGFACEAGSRAHERTR